jgi:hypothetical protein
MESGGMTKRHAKPTAAVLLARIYRQNLEFKRILLNQMAHIRLDIVSARREDREHMKTLIDHCARLLREKETLMRLKDVSAYMAAPLRCAFADNHRINHTCHVCGHLEISPDNYGPHTPPWVHTGSCDEWNADRLVNGERRACVCGQQ